MPLLRNWFVRTYELQCQGCSSQGCRRNGTCYKCSSPYVYGLDCTCSSLCVDNTRDMWTGVCPSQCNSLCETCDSSRNERFYYGDKCQFQCSLDCANLTCNHTSGECFTCNDGYLDHSVMSPAAPLVRQVAATRKLGNVVHV